MSNKKYFVRIRTTHSAKNKAQAKTLEVMADVNQTLHASLEEAKQHIQSKYDKAVALCPGKIKPPPLHFHQYHKQVNHDASISDLIYIDIFEVKPTKKEKK